MMRLTLHQLEVFESVARHQSVTLAAHDLHMTQPAVSNILKQLEGYYTCKLFEKIGRKLSLTEFGEKLLDGCQDIKTILSNTETELELLKGGLTGTLRISLVSTAKYFLPDLLGPFKQNNPNIHIKLTVDNRKNIIERLQHNADDFVIMSNPPTTQPINSIKFIDDQLVVAASQQFDKRKKSYNLNDLIEQPWIIRELGSGTRFAMEKIFKRFKLTPNIEMEISDNEAVKQAIIANLGISIISKQSIKFEVKNKLIQILNVNHFPSSHPWYLVTHKNKKLSPIAEKFFDYVQDHI